LNLTIAMQASFLVGRDKDLLDLMTDDAFRKADPALNIIDPAAFLKHVRTEVANDLGDE
jgi:predicted nucleic acid-binding protein